MTVWAASAAFVLTTISLAQVPPAVPGQFIVKYREGSASQKMLDTYVADNGNIQERLSGMLRRAERATRVPIRAIRITSGRELLVGADSARLVQRIGTALRSVSEDPDSAWPDLAWENPDVTGVRVDAIVVVLRSEALGAYPAESGLRALSRAVTEQLGVAVSVTWSDERVELRVDLERLQVEFARQLAAMDCIEYVHPDLVLELSL